MMSKEKRRVPKLRFPGFTGDWEQRKLGECMDSFEYGLNAAAKEYDGMHKYIRITDIDDETHNFIQSNLTSPDIDFNSDVSDYKLNINDIVFARTGASVGKTYLYNPNDGDLYYAGFLIRGKVNEACDAGFIYQNTLTKDYDSFIRITSQRSGQLGVNSKEYATFRLNIPCKDEQEKISNFLNSLDKLFTLHQRKLDNLKLRKKALLQKLFPKNGERYPELRFPGFTDAWEQRKLGDIATLSKGNGYSKSDLVPSGSPIILYGRLYTNYETTIKNIDTFVELKDKSVISQGGEVIVPASGETAEDISRASVVENQGIVIGGDLNVIKVKELLNPTFLALTISNGEQQKELSKRAQGKSVVHLHNSDLQEVNLIFPLLNEQKEISILFEKLDNIITLHQRKLDHLQLQKKALLQQMFV